MPKTALITITMVYDLANHFDDEDYSEYSHEEIMASLEDTVYEDLSDLMRGDRLGTWADLTLTEQEM